MMHRPIRRHVLIPLSLTFLVLFCTFIYSGFAIRHRNLTYELEQRYQGVQVLFEELVSARLKALATSVELIARDPALQKAMADKDREALLLASTPIYEHLAKVGPSPHFYFHTLDAHTFFRVHRPQGLSEPVSRLTMRQALRTGESAAGMELGKYGAFILRVVHPWRVDGELIGYIEIGEQIEGILQVLRTVKNVDFLVTIDKQYLQREGWEEGMRRMGRPAQWNPSGSHVVIHQTLDAVELASDEDLPWGKSFFHKGYRTIRLGSKAYAAKMFPLTDVGGRAVGEFTILYDTSKDAGALVTFLLQIVIFSSLLCGGLFVFAFQILGRMDRRLAVTQQELQEEFDRTSRVNRRLEEEVAERRRIEEDLKVLNEHLESRVLERTRELESLNRELKENKESLEKAYQDLQTKQATILHQDKMACIGQLAAGVAHDINNPIGFVSSNLEELQEYIPKLKIFIESQERVLRESASARQLSDLSSEKKRLKLSQILDDLDVIIEESLEGAERISKTVRNLCSFSRIDDVATKPVNLNDCLESTLTITSPEWRYKAVVHRQYEEIPEIPGYPQQFNQVFMNLLINAAQAISDNGEITVRTWAEGGVVWVTIGDNGCGIAPEILPKIFEPFFTTKEVGKGTGLGLSIAYDIVRKHGGELFVDTVVGQGTVFTLRLPIPGEGNV